MEVTVNHWSRYCCCYFTLCIWCTEFPEQGVCFGGTGKHSTVGYQSLGETKSRFSVQPCIHLDCVKQYDKHESETLTAIAEGRGSAGDIENVTTAITAVSEAYPELKSNENYKQLMNELAMTENLIAEYRSNYNKQVKEYNRYVKAFPTRVFLNILGYEKQNYTYLDYDAPSDAPQNLFGD